MNKLVKIQSETLLSRHSLSVQVLLRGNFQSLHRLFFFFWGRHFVPGAYLLIFNKYSTCLIKQNQQYPMTASVDLKDRPPKTLLASLPGNRGVGTRCRSSCSHTSYRWLRKRKSNPHCTQTFNENWIKSLNRLKLSPGPDLPFVRTRRLKDRLGSCVRQVSASPDVPVARCAQPRVAGDRELRPSFPRATPSISPSYLHIKISSI